MKTIMKELDKYITPSNILLGILFLSLIYQFMNIAPFCTINTEKEFVTIDTFEELGITMSRQERFELMNSFDEVCQECLGMTNVTECNNQDNCIFLGNKEDQHDQLLDIGGGLQHNCPAPVVSSVKPHYQHHEEYSHHDDGYPLPNCTGPNCG